MELALDAPDQPCQKLAWALSKIFAYSSGHGEEEIYISTYDIFVKTCDKTYKEVVKRITHNIEMAEQLTFSTNKALHYGWHRDNKINYPDGKCREISLSCIFVTNMSLILPPSQYPPRKLR